MLSEVYSLLLVMIVLAVCAGLWDKIITNLLKPIRFVRHWRGKTGGLMLNHCYFARKPRYFLLVKTRHIMKTKWGVTGLHRILIAFQRTGPMLLFMSFLTRPNMVRYLKTCSGAGKIWLSPYISMVWMKKRWPLLTVRRVLLTC